MARSLRESKAQFVVENIRPFLERASGQNGRLNPLGIDITPEAGALFDKHSPRKIKALLLDITTVATWVYDSIIASGVQVGVGRPLYCRRSWETDYTSYMSVTGEGPVSSVGNGTPKRPLASLLCETNDTSPTTKCLIMPGVCTVPDPSPRPSAFHDSSTSTTSSR